MCCDPEGSRQYAIFCQACASLVAPAPHIRVEGGNRAIPREAALDYKGRALCMDSPESASRSCPE